MIKTLPGSEIAYPATPTEFDTLFREVYQNENLTLIRIPATPHEQDIPSEMIKLGKGIRMREGSDLTIIATGPQLDNAMAAQDTLVSQGWDPEILYLHTIRPLDTELVRQSVNKTRRVIVVEEHMTSGGLGDDILRATRDISDVQFSSLSIPDTFVHEYATYEEHCQNLGLSSDGIIQRVGETFHKNGA
jgi:transketolase